jgi:hypothetical protein
MTNNWYKRVKVSQAVPEGEVFESDKGVKFGPLPAKPSYTEGMKVRDRRNGVALPQEFGIVSKISGNKMKIDWYEREGKKKNRSEVFDLVDDTIKLSLIVAEV